MSAPEISENDVLDCIDELYEAFEVGKGNPGEVLGKIADQIAEQRNRELADVVAFLEKQVGLASWDYIVTALKRGDHRG